MSYSFEISADRSQTNAEKYILRESLFGTADVEPVWVADMDIDTPDFVLSAVKERLNHPIIGYEEVPDSALQVQASWMKEKHEFEYEIEDVLYSHSVVASMSVAIEAFSNKGDGVIVQTPIYPPFFKSVLQLGRKVIKNPLMLNANGSYSFDLADLKKKINERTKLLLLCSPHNPVGRVWRKEELTELLNLCYENKILVFADEIHSDLVYKPYKHIPFASLNSQAKEISITAIGTGKSFNMAGFAMSTIVIQNKILYKQFKQQYDNIHFAQGCILSHIAFEAAYTHGNEWLEDLKVHLHKNYRLLEKLCLKYPEFIKITPIEATYLAWLDCRNLESKNKNLANFFIKEAKLGLNRGISFSKEGNGFMRLNFAVSCAKMSEIILRLDNALACRRKNYEQN